MFRRRPTREVLDLRQQVADQKNEIDHLKATIRKTLTEHESGMDRLKDLVRE